MTNVKPLFKIWAGVDSNHRTLSWTDLQSVAFSHSATYPYKVLNCLWRDLNSWPLPYQGSALPLRHKGIFQKLFTPFGVLPLTKDNQSFFGRVPAPQRQMPQGLREKFSLLSKKPVIGIEPTTYGLQNRCSTVELYRRQVKYNWNIIWCQELEIISVCKLCADFVKP